MQPIAPKLTQALSAWRTLEFRNVLKEELEQLDPEQLPLQQGLSVGNYVSGDKFNAMILDASEDENFIHARAGIFYNSIIGGCACADDPTPISELNEYCEVRLAIDKNTAETTVTLAPEPAEKAEI